MRLIDADKLMESLNPKESVWVGLILSELIDNAPIVEAIPKEWIKDYMLRLPDGSEAYECILVMLEEWERENG